MVIGLENIENLLTSYKSSSILSLSFTFLSLSPSMFSFVCIYINKIFILRKWKCIVHCLFMWMILLFFGIILSDAGIM